MIDDPTIDKIASMLYSGEMTFEFIVPTKKSSYPLQYTETKLKYPFYDNKNDDKFAKLVTHLQIPIGKTSFDIKVRDIFKSYPITHTSGRESRHWLSGTDMKYWLQQLNFAVWAATKGCGVGVDMFDNAFLRFHVAFTMRSLLRELNVPLPGDKVFNPKDNNYDKIAKERLKNEFKLTNPDFRNKEGAAQGLGETYFWSGGPWIPRKGMGYPREWEFADLGCKGMLCHLVVG